MALSKPRIHAAVTAHMAAALWNADPKTRLEHYRRAYQKSIPEDNFDQELWKAVEIVSGTVDESSKTGKAVYQLTVPARYANYTGNLMGGATSTIMDGLTNCTVALIAKQGSWDLNGVTTNFHITYLSPVSQGQVIEVECEILRSSDRLVVIQGTMKRVSDGKILVHAMQEMVALEKGVANAKL